MQHNPRITAVAKLSSSHKAIDTLSFHQLYLFRSVTTIIKTLLLCNAFKEKTKKARQYASYTANLTNDQDKIGVLCSWFSRSSMPEKFCIGMCEKIHDFTPASKYLCTLPESCFLNSSTSSSSLLDAKRGPHLITSEDITIDPAALHYVNTLAHKKSELTCSLVVHVPDQVEKPNKKCWVQIDKIVLHKKEQQEIVAGKPLSDLHVGAYQKLLRSKVANLKGLQNPVFQQPIRHDNVNHDGQDLTLQIVHVRTNHWIAIQVISASDVCIYDSSYSSVSNDTQLSISKLMCSKEREITVHLMNVHKQTGSTDCALFAMACITHLALGEDPTSVIFRQSELRSHLIKSFETLTIKKFPVSKTRKPISRESKVESFEIFCTCRLSYHKKDKRDMIECGVCKEWYHGKCLGIDVDEEKEKEFWACPFCTKTN